MAFRQSGLYGEWDKTLKKLEGLEVRMRRNMRQATAKNARMLRDAMVRKITQGDPSWPPLSPLTTQVKGSDKPLLDNGDLRNSFKDIPIDLDTRFVGVSRNEKSSDGVDMVNIMAVQEHGVTIRPNQAQALAIPATLEARRLAIQYGGVKNVPDLFIPHGTNVLARKTGENDFEVMYILKAEVVIPPRPVIMPTYNEMKPKLAKSYRDAAQRALRGSTLVA